MTKDSGRSLRDGLSSSGSSQQAVSPLRASIPSATFLRDAANYFERRSTGGEDMAFWANVYNAQNCRKAADLIERYHEALVSIVSWHADARDVFPDWETTAHALAEIADDALEGRSEWPAQAIETRSAEPVPGSVEDESAVPQGMRQETGAA